MKKYKLGELMEVTRGMSLCGEYYATEGDLMRLTLGNFDYRNNCFKDDKSKDNLFFSGDVKDEFILNKGDIITPLTEQAIGLLGSTAKVPCSGKYIQSQDVGLIKCNEKLHPDFAFYLIPSKLVRNQLSAAAQQTKIRHTSPDKIKSCTVWIPEYLNQEKIGRLLSSLDDKIALNRRMNAKLEQMAKRLYDHWFVQFDFPNADGKPYKASGGKMVWDETLKRKIPDGWEVKKLGEFAKYVDNTDSADMIVNYISTDNMLPNKAGISEVISKPLKGNFVRYEKFDVLISNIRPYFKKIWFSNLVGNCSTDVLCIRSNSKSDSFFIYRTLWKDEFFDYVMKGAKGSKMPRGDKTRIMNYSFVYPINNPEILKSFSSFFAPLQNIIWTNEKETQKLTLLRDHLLPLLMNGQVEVK